MENKEFIALCKKHIVGQFFKVTAVALLVQQ